MSIESWVGIILGVIGFNVIGWYQYEKSYLIKDIKCIVSSCRSRPSFDDHSECKLIQWLEGSEDELHRKSLFKLRHIKKEMYRYLDIHINMDLDNNLL